jgi:hypothetical protein
VKSARRTSAFEACLGRRKLGALPCCTHPEEWRVWSVERWVACGASTSTRFDASRTPLRVNLACFPGPTAATVLYGQVEDETVSRHRVTVIEAASKTCLTHGKREIRDHSRPYISSLAHAVDLRLYSISPRAHPVYTLIVLVCA